jgi:hypothetical protein
MGHSVQLVVGRNDAVARFLRDWPGTRAIALLGEWQAIPVEDGLGEAIAARWPEAKRPEQLDMSPPGMSEALAAATSGSGGLAYVETDYWGGSGGQSAMAWLDGREVLAPARATGAAGPINSALRAIGVKRSEEADEFDTIGLGLRRSMSDYEPEGPVRLRGATPALDETTREQTLPVWAVLMLIAAFIGLGVAIAMMR